MILSALVQRYENQLAEGKIPKPGWSKAKISFGLRLNESGEIADIIDLRTEVQSGKKLFAYLKKRKFPNKSQEVQMCCHISFAIKRHICLE